MTNHESRVREFMRLANQATPDAPGLPSDAIRLLRARLILEEALETIHALGCFVTRDLEIQESGMAPDLIEIADGCADTIIVCTGTLLACGIPLEPLLEMVDESNIKKYEGDYSFRADGKLVKPTNWQKPDIAGLLANLQKS